MKLTKELLALFNKLQSLNKKKVEKILHLLYNNHFLNLIMMACSLQDGHPL
jgi:hypothetical protein